MWLTMRHQHRDAGQRRQGEAHREHRLAAGLPVSRAGEQFLVRLQGEQHAQRVRDDQQDGQAHAQLLGELGPRDRVRLRHRRRNQQADRGQEQQARLHAGADAVEFLLVILETAKEQGDAQHEQRVGDDRAGNGRLHQHKLPGPQGGERNHQFRQVAERGVEQAANRITGLGRHGFGGVTEQGGQRHDGQDRQREEQRVRVVRELSAANTTGTKTSSQSSLLCWISLSSCFMVQSCSAADLELRIC